jgi:serine protease
MQTGAVIVKLRRGANTSALRQLLQNAGARLHRTGHGMNAVVIQPGQGSMSTSLANRLRQSGIVEYTEPETMMYACAAPNDPNYSQQWGLQDSGYGIKAQSAWSMANGQGITVAVLDTGIRQDCPDLKGTRFVAGFNTLNNSTATADDNGHGTHVSGTIAQTTNNSYGCAGVAHGATLMPIKVLAADGSGSNFAVAAGIRWAADHGAKVINMSLGGGGGTTLLEAVRYAVAKGVVLCCAAGNSGSGSLSYPAAYPETISVGALASTGKRASFSQYGTGLSVMAPGVNILQQTWSPQQGQFVFGSWAGTSMATPHVAGTVALILSRNPNLSPAQVKDLLQRTSRDLNGAGWDSETGYGLIDAQAAVNGAGGGGTTPAPGPSPAPSPGNPVFDVAVTQIQAPASAGLNATVPISVQVQNKGNSTVDARVTLSEGPAGDSLGQTTVRVAPGETSSANFNWAAGNSAGSRQVAATAAIVGQTDADTSDNRRVATINVGGGGGTPGASLRFRVYTYNTTYRIGATVYLRHIVEDSTGQRVGGVPIQGTLTGANGRSLSYSGTTRSDGTYNASVRLQGGGGTGTYTIRAQATPSGAPALSASHSFNVVR